MTQYAENELGYRVALTGGGEEVRAESFKQIREDGFDRSIYEIEGLPIGTRRVVLERKLWTRGASGIMCFLLDKESGQRYRLAVFRHYTHREYLAGDLDISRTPCGTVLEVLIHQNKTGTFRIKEARKLDG